MAGKPAASAAGREKPSPGSDMVFLETHDDVADTMRLILESTGEGIYGLDSRGHCTFINRAAARMFGVEPGRVVGKDMHELVHHSRAGGDPYPRELCPINITCTEGVSSQVEDEVFWRLDGSSFPIVYSSFPIIDRGRNRGAVVAFSDVTAQQAADEELRRANEKLQAVVSDLERRNHEVVLLNEMGDRLQTCKVPEAAQEILSESVAQLFPKDSGALCMINDGNLVEAVAAWGEVPFAGGEFAPEDCWALRRLRPHVVADPGHGTHCAHLGPSVRAPYLCVPMLSEGQPMGLLHVMLSPGAAEGRSIEAVQPLARTVAEHIRIGMANFNLRQTLKIQSIRDPLTGLYNRRFMEETINREIPRATRYQRQVGIILFDIDFFKTFNDTFGHAAGDTVLSTLGEFVRRHIRTEDVACRYGGEEILLILPDASLEVTQARAETLRVGVSEMRLEHQGDKLGALAISVGVAAFPVHGVTGDVLLRAADAALYRAKAGGRNRVEVAIPPD